MSIFAVCEQRGTELTCIGVYWSVADAIIASPPKDGDWQRVNQALWQLERWWIMEWKVVSEIASIMEAKHDEHE